MKLLLYCTKAKPILRDYRDKAIYNRFVISPTDRPFTSDDTQPILNGKIVAECDFEVEEIEKKCVGIFEYCYRTKTLDEYDLMYKTQFSNGESMNEYLQGKGYAIHIKNLHIFDKPRFIQDYSKNENPYNYIENAPQNMMYAFDVKSFNESEKKVLISIQPQWLCKILNGEKTIECRKRILKEMMPK